MRSVVIDTSTRQSRKHNAVATGMFLSNPSRSCSRCSSTRLQHLGSVTWPRVSEIIEVFASRARAAPEARGAKTVVLTGGRRCNRRCICICRCRGGDLDADGKMEVPVGASCSEDTVESALVFE